MVKLNDQTTIWKPVRLSNGLKEWFRISNIRCTLFIELETEKLLEAYVFLFIGQTKNVFTLQEVRTCLMTLLI